MDFSSPYFLGLLHSAQDGNTFAMQLVVLASRGCVYGLTQDPDESQELFQHLIEYTLPRWTEVHDWAVHCRVTLLSRLKTLRRTECRRKNRGMW